MAEALKKKEINVLSFDGGGSRGIMEAMMLDDVMKTATLMYDKPDDIITLLSNDRKLEKIETRKKLQEIIKTKVSKPVHPTEVFQFIAGKNKILNFQNLSNLNLI